METQVDLGAELQGRKDNDSVVATKDVSAVEPTVFDEEEVTITMAQTLIKIKAEKARIFDEQMAKRLHDKEVEQVTAKEKQEKNDLEKAKGLQQQYDDKQENIDWNAIAEQIQEKHLNNIRKYQSLKRKPISIAQARKNMFIYLKNMAGYKMEHFRFEVTGSESTRDTPTNDLKEMSEEDVKNMLEIIPVSEFKVEALQVKYPLIDWEIHSEGSRSYLKIIRVGGITEAYQSFEDMLKGFDREDLDALWRLVKEKFKKDYPLSNVVMIMMLSAKLQVEEDSDMATYLVMNIFMEANKPKSRSLDTSSNFSLILATVNMSLTDINASLTEHNLHQQCKFFSRGNSSTQQLEHFFTSSGQLINSAVGTFLH
nr:leucine-rich repeat protein [Tanacetum cinerariifolium]